MTTYKAIFYQTFKIKGKLPINWSKQVKDIDITSFAEDLFQIKEINITAKTKQDNLIDRTIKIILTTDSIDYDTDGEEVLDILYDNLLNLKQAPNFLTLDLEGDAIEIIEAD